MNYIFIVNPISGKNKGLIASKVIESYCREKGINYKIIYTEKSGDARTWASIYSNLDNNIIYSVGGDGTLNEIVNGMVYSKSPISIVPVGSGNDFYKTLITNNTKTIDIGKVNDRFFINIASIGLDAEIALTANNLKKYKLPSNSIYVLSAIKNYFKFKNIPTSINNLHNNIKIFTICNGKYYGGGFKIAPYARINDGLFDIIEVDELGKLKTLGLILKLLNGTHIDDKKVKFYQANNIIINSKTPLICNIDGEIIRDNNFKFNIYSNAIKLYNDELKINSLLRSKKIIK